MTKTLVLIIVILIVGFFVLWGIMALISWANRLEDDEHQEKLKVTRELREAADDFRYDQEVAKRTNDLNDKPRKGKR